MYIDQNLLIKYILPISKRTDDHVAWLDCLLDPMQRLNIIEDEYENGSSAMPYVNSFTYSMGDLVNGGASYSFSIFESQKDSNNNNPLSDTTYWLNVNNFMIGVNERANFRANKMVFEYGLNRYYGTTFRQPSDVVYSPTQSTIYIEDNFISYPSFIVGMQDNASHFFDTFSDAYIIDGTFFYATYQFTIWVPFSLLSSLPDGYNNIRNIADRYNTYGIIYNIQGY